MKNQRWLAAFSGIVAIFLLIEGGWTLWIIDALHRLEPIAGTPFASAEEVASAKSYLPAMYLVAIEGLLFGAIALVGAVALLTGKPWARRMLFVASFFLALTVAVAVGMAPHTWHTQGVFLAFCVLLWLESRKWSH